jgi:hypothetical protein
MKAHRERYDLVKQIEQEVASQYVRQFMRYSREEIVLRKSVEEECLWEQE